MTIAREGLLHRAGTDGGGASRQRHKHDGQSCERLGSPDMLVAGVHECVPRAPTATSPISEALAAFLDDRRSRALSPRTVEFYREKLAAFLAYLQSHGVVDVPSVTASVLRCYLLHLGGGHNPGGVHAHYRVMRAFLNWWEDEVEPEGWRNPLRKVKPPKVPVEPLAPVHLADLQALLDACSPDTLIGCRDRAILLCLYDSGCRAQEFVDLSCGDVNLLTGECLVRRGKGAKPRSVFLGTVAREALCTYLTLREDKESLAPLWATRSGTRLTYAGLREILRRLARRAGVPQPSIHSFRRGFALTCLRNGIDVYTLQRLMGHSGLTVLQRYLAQTTEDLRRAHAKLGPIDGFFGRDERN